MNFNVVIPARYESTRLPGKPLLDLVGQTMIQRVVKQAMKSQAASVLVATDDSRIQESVRVAGAEALLTSAAHTSGSDRVMEVAKNLGWNDSAIVVNVQGDEPLIPPSVIDQVAKILVSNKDLGVATLCEPIEQAEDVFNPNIVKVVRDNQNIAMYFSRAPVPWSQDWPRNKTVPKLEGSWFRHVGIYAYRVWALRRFVELSQGSLETRESLEQLRFLENGIQIAVEEASLAVPGGIDTPEDAERIRKVIAAD